MKKLILLLMAILITGCSAEYNLEYKDGLYKESLFNYGEKNEKINDDLFSNLVSEYYNKNIIVTYNAQPGDIKNEEYPLYFQIYNKRIIDDNKFGLLLDYNYKNKDDYKKSTIINELFYSINLGENYIEMKDIKDIFSNYNYLDKITISFKADKYIKTINSDEKKDNTYYWYIDKSNYNNKSIYIVYANNRLDSINTITKDNADKVIDITLLGIALFIFIFIIIIYERIRVSSK